MLCFLLIAFILQYIVSEFQHSEKTGFPQQFNLAFPLHKLNGKEGKLMEKPTSVQCRFTNSGDILKILQQSFQLYLTRVLAEQQDYAG